MPPVRGHPIHAYPLVSNSLSLPFSPFPFIGRCPISPDSLAEMVTPRNSFFFFFKPPNTFRSQCVPQDKGTKRFHRASGTTYRTLSAVECYSTFRMFRHDDPLRLAKVFQRLCTHRNVDFERGLFHSVRDELRTSVNLSLKTIRA